MKLIKFVFFLAHLIALTKKGYSGDPARKPLTDTDDNADEDSVGGVHVKAATWRPSAEAFLTKRCTIGKRMSYHVRSHDTCVKNMYIVVNNGVSYEHYKCNTHSIMCTLNYKCKNVVSYSSALGKTYISGCTCMAD